MARVEYGSLLTSIHGSLGGHTFQDNKFGHTLKNKPMQPAPLSSAQRQNQINLSLVSQYWRSMTTYQQSQWSDFASTYPQYPYGSSVALSGFQVFCKFNIYQLTIARTIIDYPVSEPVTTTDFAPVLTSNLPDLLLLYYNQTSSITGNLYGIGVSQDLPYNNAVSRFKNRICGVSTGGLPYLDFSDKYISYYGRLPIVVNWVKIEIQEFNYIIQFLPAKKTYIIQVQASI